MIVKAITAPEAASYLHYRFENSDREPVTHEVGTGSRFSDQVYQELREQLCDLRESFDERNDEALLRFDVSAAEILHRLLKLDDAAAANDEFWTYLASVELFDDVVWRHQRTDPESGEVLPPSDDHFGLGDKWGCLPKRLWYRAELSKTDHVEDPYRLTRRGGMDFWTSGVLRKLYPSSRVLTRALVRFQYPEEGRFEGNHYRPQTLTLGGVRELYKRLRHFNAFVVYPALSDAEADDLICSIADGLPRQ